MSDGIGLNYGTRADGTPKGRGYFGELPFHDGRTSTEISVGVNIDGNDIEIPTLVPTLTQTEIQHLLGGNGPTEGIIQKAVTHARTRLGAGKSPFAGPDEQVSLSGNKMSFFDDDPNPNAGISLRPGQNVPGIGIGEPDFQSLPGVEKAGYALREFGAGLLGKDSPMEKEIVAKRQDKLRKMQEFKFTSDMLDDSVKRLKGLSGETRTQYVEAEAKRMDEIKPGTGATLRALSKRPDVLTSLGSYKDVPEFQLAFSVGGEEAVQKLVSSPEFMNTLEKRVDVQKLPTVTKRVQALMANYQQIVPPEMAKEIAKDGVITASEIMQINEAVKASGDKFSALALDEAGLAVLGRNQDAVYGPLGVLTGKQEQEVLKERAKKAGEPAKPPSTRKVKRDTPQGTIEVAQSFVDGKWVDEEKGAAFRPRDAGEGGAAGGKVPKAIIDIELKLADDYSRDTKKFSERRPVFESATDYISSRTPKTKTSAGDAALMYAYAKMRDSNDRIAVSETKDLKKLGNIFERFGVSVEAILDKGETLPDRVAKQMYNEILRNFTQLNEAQSKVEQMYSKRAKDYVGTDERVVNRLAVPSEQLKPKKDAKSEDRKTINGKTYVKKDGKWFEE